MACISSYNDTTMKSAISLPSVAVPTDREGSWIHPRIHASIASSVQSHQNTTALVCAIILTLTYIQVHMHSHDLYTSICALTYLTCSKYMLPWIHDFQTLLICSLIHVQKWHWSIITAYGMHLERILNEQNIFTPLRNGATIAV